MIYANRSNAKGALNDFKGQLEDLNKAISLSPLEPSLYIEKQRRLGN